MKKLVCLAVLVVGSLCSEAKAGFVNGGFETGDLSGWTVGGTGSVSVVSSYSTTSGPSATFNPTEGNFFALLVAGNANVYTTLTQSFSVSAGDTLFGSAFYDANDYTPYLDDAYIKILEGNTVLFYSDVDLVGDYGNTPWTSFSHTFAVGGTYTLEAGVRNLFDSANTPLLGIDGFLASAAPVPEPAQS